MRTKPHVHEREKKTGIPKRTRRKLFKAGKRKRKRRNPSLVPSSSSSSLSCSALKKKTLPGRKPKPSSSSTPQTGRLEQKEVLNTRRRLFKPSERKRKQALPATTPCKRKPPVTPIIQVPFSDVSSTGCPREQLLAAKLPQ